MNPDAWPRDHHVPVAQNRWDQVAAPAAAPTVSVIVCHYDQQADLDRLLAAMARQRGQVELREVIVVDDGSPVAPTVPGHIGAVPVTVLRQEDRGIRPAAARNLGARHSRGEVLVFFDADTAPGPETVARLAALPAVTPDAVTVGRRYHVDLEGWSPSATADWLDGTGLGPTPLEDPAWLRDGYRGSSNLVHVDDRSYQYVIGAVMAMSRSFFDHLGGFDGSITTYGGEDWELAYRAYVAGGVLAHVPDAAAFHNGEDWAARHDHRGLKNDERLVVAALVPGAADAIVGPWAPVCLTLHAVRWSLDATVATIADVLADGATAVRVAVVDGPDGLGSVVAADGRVCVGAHPEALRQRSLTQIDLAVPVLIEPGGIAALTALVAPGGPGQVELVDGGEVVGTVAATRARARARRWAERHGGIENALAELFGCERAPLPGPVRRSKAPVDLTVWFPR